MSASLNTARALLEAKNYEGARRIVRKALDDNPQNARAWRLRCEIEIEGAKPKDALALVRQVLADRPDDPALRSLEFDALMKAGKKREAAKVRDRFKEDFSFLSNRIEMMTLQLDAAKGRTKAVGKKLREYGEHLDDPASLKNLGIAHHRTDDLFRAERMMSEAHPEFAGDAELNAAMAANYFQLARPGAARRYARLALAADPADRRMAFLIRASWAMYWPPFWLLSVILVIFYAADALLGRIGAYVATLAAVLALLNYSPVVYSVLIVLTGYELGWLSTVGIVVWIVVYMMATNPGLYAKVFKRRKSVALKKY